MARGRIGVAPGVVALERAIERDGDAQQDQGVQPHRPQREAITQAGDGRPAQHGSQRHRAAGGMQAPQAEHRADGQGDRPGGRHARHGYHLRAEHPDQGRHQIARQDGPGLGQRAGRRGEQQHGRCPHRGDEPGVGAAQRVAAHPFRAEQSHQRAHDAIQLLAPVDADGRWRERA
ncbi:hypothetical protein G6F68_011122 [Rhizopus microsporus]|nr:hypothetical protein G6F68_011122 [Rhizopus microsporus]